MSNPDSGKSFDKKKIKGLENFYRNHLLHDVLPFWETRTTDHEHGGYITCFDREGNVTDTEKYIWFQGRQLWMFPALYNRLEKKDKWLRLAKQGRDYIVKYAYAGGGRWFYQLDNLGNVKKGAVSIYTDLFVLAGLCEYAAATGSEEDLPLIRATYDAIEKNVYDLDFKDIFHATWSPRYKRHGIYMISLNVAQIAGRILGAERARPLIDHCLDQILNVFAKDEYELLFESVGRDGSVFADEAEGRVINPGHICESMWFCYEEGKRRKDRAVIDRVVKIIDWAYRIGYDQGYGGIVSFVDSSGEEPAQMDWHKETDTYWHDKVWWVHSEALYALAFSAVETDDPERFNRFLDLHTWCQEHFYDPEYGEWYSTVRRDGSPKDTDKGTLWKAAYHLPRALLMIMKLFESVQ